MWEAKLIKKTGWQCYSKKFGIKTTLCFFNVLLLKALEYKAGLNMQKK